MRGIATEGFRIQTGYGGHRHLTELDRFCTELSASFARSCESTSEAPKICNDITLWHYVMFCYSIYIYVYIYTYRYTYIYIHIHINICINKYITVICQATGIESLRGPAGCSDPGAEASGQAAESLGGGTSLGGLWFRVPITIRITKRITKKDYKKDYYNYKEVEVQGSYNPIRITKRITKKDDYDFSGLGLEVPFEGIYRGLFYKGIFRV